MLRIGKCLVSRGVNGPGKRLVIWFQGCPLRCEGCFNPEFWREDGGILVSRNELIAQIRSTPDIEGVTFSGGEPLAQARQIVPLARWVKSAGLTIVCYTGYLLEDILEDRVPYAKQLIQYVDILIDGRYVASERAPLLWRGSRNQRVHFLTQTYKHLEPLALVEGEGEVEFQIGNNTASITGIFDVAFWARLRAELSSNKGGT